MNSLYSKHLFALGADQPISDKMLNELDFQGFTIIPNLIDPDWLNEMRRTFDQLVAKEGEQSAIEHHKEEKATRLANLVNKGIVWEKVWSHPLLLAACAHVFKGEFKVSSLNGREALQNGGHQSLHGDWKKPRPDFPNVHVLNSIWAIDDLSMENGSPRIIAGTHNRPELPENVLSDPNAPHPKEIILECPAGSVMVFNAHTWHGGTTNKNGARRRVLHGYFTRRKDPQQQDQRTWITEETFRRLTPSQKWLLDVS
jgi:hypothetical protein